jgi:ABC-type lipoprotein export system ATPase subunit
MRIWTKWDAVRGVEVAVPDEPGGDHFPGDGLWLENIRKSYGGERVVDVDRLFIPFGAVTVLFGYSGSGKTTLINIIGLLDVPDLAPGAAPPRLTIAIADSVYRVTYAATGGTVKARVERYDRDGAGVIQWQKPPRPCTAADLRRAHFSYVFQKPLLHPNLDLDDNINVASIAAAARPIDADWLGGALETLGMAGLQRRYPHQVSGGEAQRAALMRCLVKGSAIMIGDEPTSNLDEQRAEQILALYRDTVRQTGAALIWVTHNVGQAHRHADQVVVIKRGKARAYRGLATAEALSALLQQDRLHRVEELPPPRWQNGAAKRRMLSVAGRYALSDFFPRTAGAGSAGKGHGFPWFRPTADFLTTYVAVFAVLVFVLVAMKVAVATQKFIEAKLSDPRVNYLSVQGRGGHALSPGDVATLRAIGGGQVFKVVPTYETELAVSNDLGASTLIAGTVRTFRVGDPIIERVLADLPPDTRARPFLSDPAETSTAGIVIYRSRLERAIDFLNEDAPEGGRLARSPDRLRVSVKGSHDQTVPVVITDSFLPNATTALIREDFYLKAFHGQADGGSHVDPSPRAIYVYPSRIQNLPVLVDRIADHGAFRLVDVGTARTKFEIAEELRHMLLAMAVLSGGAVAALSLLFVGVVIYRGIHRKRREIGVLLAYGMSLPSFMAFYFLESLIISVLSAVSALGLFYGAFNPLISTIVARTRFLGDVPVIVDVARNPGLLDLEPMAVVWVCLGTQILLSVLFTVLILSRILQAPVALLRTE